MSFSFQHHAWRLRLLALAALLHTGTAQAEPFAFRGVTLGTSLADLRRLRYPEAPDARILCSHDAEAAEIRPTSDFSAGADEARAGVSVCGAFTYGKVLGPASKALPPEWMPARVRVGAIDTAPMFWFVSGDSDDIENQGRLYRIAMRSNVAYWEDTKAAFIRRYGEPTGTEKGSLPVLRGKSIETETVTWTNPESTIRLVKRWDAPMRMRIVYELHALVPGAANAAAAQGKGL